MKTVYKNYQTLDLNNILVTYSLSGKDFSVLWTKDKNTNEFYLDDACVSSECIETRDRVFEALQAGDCDENKDLELYLFVRDCFDKEDCLKMLEKEMEILSSEISDYNDETALVEAGIGSDSVTFHVQTTGGEYRPSLGCWITVDGSSEDIDQDDFLGFDFNRIISEAEKLLESKFKKYKGFTIQEIKSEFKVLEENRNYLNRVASSYTEKYEELGSFTSEAEAMEFIDKW